MTDRDHLDRINALTRNARTTWFALLAALVFVGITLMGVEHIDFYGVDRATQLPLVNVEVPTRYFFVAAPILITAIYGYFHLYLIRLWDALGAAPTRLNGIRLGDAVSPWLVTDAALHLRRRMRHDNATTPRTLEGGAMLLNFLLAWGFGLIVLYYLWQLSMPAREFWMTGIAAAAFATAIITGASSLAMLARRMRHPPDGNPPVLWGTWFQTAGLLIGGAALIWNSYQKTEGPAVQLAALNLSGETIVERPPGWLGYADARAEFRADWCRREREGRDCTDFGDREADFAMEFERRRHTARTYLHQPDWQKKNVGESGMDFRGADLDDSFLVGANLSRAQMEWTSLIRSQMEGVKLQGARIERTFFNSAQMEGANLQGAQMVKTAFTGAQLKGSNLSLSKMTMVTFTEANMQGARFDFSQWTGTPNGKVSLIGTDLSRSANRGGMLRFFDMTEAQFDLETDFRNTFLDGSVDMSPAFRTQMGDPCQWVDERLDDTEFYGRWRGWIETAPDEFDPPPWPMITLDDPSDVEAIPPPAGCTWKTGPMPDAAAN